MFNLKIHTVNQPSGPAKTGGKKKNTSHCRESLAGVELLKKSNKVIFMAVGAKGSPGIWAPQMKRSRLRVKLSISTRDYKKCHRLTFSDSEKLAQEGGFAAAAKQDEI